VLRWHRDLVRWKWTFKRKAKPGKPWISFELEALIFGLVCRIFTPYRSFSPYRQDTKLIIAQNLAKRVPYAHADHNAYLCYARLNM
jgi:hypothetical protein